MTGRCENMFAKGYENKGDVDRIYKLIENLENGHDTRFVEPLDPGSEWVVDFAGDPSIRHANRISIFKEFLAEHLSARVRISAAMQGSVLVEYAPEFVTDEYKAKAKKLASTKQEFIDIARKLGIKKISFGGIDIKF